MNHACRYAIGGVLLTLPFVLGNLIVSQHFTPWDNYIHAVPGVLWVALTFMCAGAVVASWPMWYRREWYWLNGIISIVIAVISVTLIGAFADEFMRCDMLTHPNCD
ncbi:MAG: hypothetical protein ACK5C8_11505 [Roseiflexaceae bacterium]|jgi:cytochrome c biogenesis protein CcdA|nr:hypothetical protein [Chloroflexaceae bacterium]